MNANYNAFMTDGTILTQGSDGNEAQSLGIYQTM